MSRISLTIKDESKLEFIRELISQFDFVEITEAKKKQTKKNSFFDSAGIWENRDISVESIRELAWKRNH